MSKDIYHRLLKQGIEVLWDDREVSPGEKFADSDLLGIPFRVVISERGLAANKVEIKERTSSQPELIEIADLAKWLQENV